ncbi:MAG: hypothetical protein JSU04_11495 [Bdellovibrionales bacterium]|nr:hypothetical protein [Bdellovibrionales bacterium]
MTKMILAVMASILVGQAASAACNPCVCSKPKPAECGGGNGGIGSGDPIAIVHQILAGTLAK